MANITIGYNLKEAKKVMDDVADGYEQLGKKIEKGWNDLDNILKANWVGEDEQDFEVKFVERLNNLYTTSYQLTKNCNENICSLARDWFLFQQNNKLEIEGATSSGSISTDTGKFSLEAPEIRTQDPLVTVKLSKLNENTDRGLSGPESAETLREGVTTFVTQLKNEINGIFTSIEVNKAFLGDQASSIKAYIGKVGEALASVVTAVKDLNDGLANLAGQNYIGTVENFSGGITEAGSATTTSLDETLASKKWS